MGKGFLLGLAIGLAVGIAAMLSMVAHDPESTWPFSADGMLQAGASIVGAVVAFLGISWQIRATFDVQRRQRHEARLERAAQIARALWDEMDMHLLAFNMSASRERPTEILAYAREHAFLWSAPAYERLKGQLDDLNNASVTAQVDGQYRGIQLMRESLEDPNSDPSRTLTHFAGMHRMHAQQMGLLRPIIAAAADVN